MRVFKTTELPKRNAALSKQEQHWIYNGLDAAVTIEVWDILEAKLKEDPAAQLTYNFEAGMQGPALQMMQRGFAIDHHARHEVISSLSDQKIRYQGYLDRIAETVWGRGLNPNSPTQLIEFFYTKMGLPPVTVYDKATRTSRPTTNRKAIEKLQTYFFAQPICKLILKIRELTDKISVLNSGLSPDGRLRCSFNVAGTETGRWSSSKDAFTKGTNCNNITDELRRVIIADPGMKLGQIDLEQAESRIVALLSGDENYQKACESGDLHTYCAKLMWPELPWPAEAKPARALAESPFYRWFSYRDMSKRGGHLTNYYGTPPMMSMHLQLPQAVCQQFQSIYFSRFPGITTWHNKIITQIQAKREMTTALGRRRQFFGRPEDRDTWKEGIAYEPQSIIGDVLNLGLYRLWLAGYDILGQVYDSVLFQYDPKDEATVIPKAVALVATTVHSGGKSIRVPAAAAVGWNWGKVKKKDGKIENEHGLQDWTGVDTRSPPVRDTSSPPQLARSLQSCN